MVHSVARILIIPEVLHQRFSEIRINIDGLMFKSGFIELDLLTMSRVFSTEERLFPGYALGSRRNRELSIFFAGEFPV